VTVKPDDPPTRDTREPGYCLYGCGFHLVTPIPGRSPGTGICGNCEQAGRATLPPPGEYEQTRGRARTWRQQRRVQHTAEQFWDYGDGEEPGSPFGAFLTSTRWRHLWRALRQWLRGR
jgi:hypothetical protein